MLPKITTIHKHVNNNNRYIMISFNNKEFIKYFKRRVQNYHKMTDKKQIIMEQITKLKIINGNAIKEILENSDPLEDTNWRIGESIACCYLEDYHKIKFPYDKRISDSNPRLNRPGVDLLGITMYDKKPMLLFGEIKTTENNNHPPKIIYELKKQLIDLTKTKNREKHTKFLLLNLEHIKGVSKIKIMKAISSSINDELCICGILIKNGCLIKKDLSNVFEKMNPNFIKMNLDMHALQIPIPINKLQKTLDIK